jgi:methenyltetrahydromethanopterin cyclohydrolase
MISLNECAYPLVEHMIAESDALGVELVELPCGTVVLDTGVTAPGSLEAGRLFAEICLAGLAKVSFCQTDLDLPGVVVWAQQPVLACMASQYAGWAIKDDGEFFAMGSGPARALYCGEPLFETLGYRDQADVAVLALEGRRLPTEKIARKIAKKCDVSPDRLYLLIAPTASLVGSVQVAARVVETGLHKMLELGFDLSSVQSGIGSCPLAPIAGDDLRAIGRTNDGVLYGGRTWYTIRDDDAQIEEIIQKMPSCASTDYGTPFYELFKKYDGDFYKIDPMLFSPAEVSMNSLVTGRSFSAGGTNPDMIKRALLG